MSFEEPIVELNQVSKSYAMYAQPVDRLKQFLVPRLRRWLPFFGRDRYFTEFWSLRNVSIQVKRGEVLGLVGANGAGKSTLLKLICGVLQTSSGSLQVRGRIAALLELGAGFNPEFTGRENIYLNASLYGLKSDEINQRMDDIIAFADIGMHIDYAVKTYSSGMFVRLAFSIATSVEPEVLIIDEALSVGDGAFARKSFDRIMALKARGVTILFCSHNIYQVEALSHRVLWLDRGRVREFGLASKVCQLYNLHLEQEAGLFSTDSNLGVADCTSPQMTPSVPPGSAIAKLVYVQVFADGNATVPIHLQSEKSTLSVSVAFAASPELPCPSVAVVITDARGQNISSCSTFYDKIDIQREATGSGRVRLDLEKIQLLRGSYFVNVFLMCEQSIHIYDSVRSSEFEVFQSGLEIGLVALKRRWG